MGAKNSLIQNVWKKFKRQKVPWGPRATYWTGMKIKFILNKIVCYCVVCTCILRVLVHVHLTLLFEYKIQRTHRGRGFFNPNTYTQNTPRESGASLPQIDMGGVITRLLGLKPQQVFRQFTNANTSK